MGNITELTENNFKDEVLETAGKVLVDFWAPWCGPCRMQTPILEKLIESGDISAKITKMNTDENLTLAQEFGIQSIPTLILFEDGKEIDRMVGVQAEEALKEKLK